MIHVRRTHGRIIHGRTVLHVVLLKAKAKSKRSIAHLARVGTEMEGVGVGEDVQTVGHGMHGRHRNRPFQAGGAKENGVGGGRGNAYSKGKGTRQEVQGN